MEEFVAFLFVSLVGFWILGVIVVAMTAQGKRIGVGPAVGIAIFFSPVVGLIVTMLSRDYEDINREKKILEELKKLNELKSGTL